MPHLWLASQILIHGCGLACLASCLAGCAPPASPPASPPPARPATAATAATAATGGIDDTERQPPTTSASARREQLLADIIAQSAQLTRLLLAGEADAAQALFAPRLRREITPQALASLSFDLRKLLGREVINVRPVDTLWGDVDQELRQQTLRVQHLVELEQGQSAISSVQFLLPLAAVGASEQAVDLDAVELVAIDVRQTWPAYAPRAAQVAHQALELLLGGFASQPDAASPAGEAASPTPATTTPEQPSVEQPSVEQAAEAFAALLPERMSGSLRLEALRELLVELRQHIGPTREPAAWLTWSYQTAGSHLAVQGEIVTHRGPVEVMLDFADDRLIGVSLVSQHYAASTLDLLAPQLSLAERGQQFWEGVFGDQWQTAYGLLATEFQRQMSADAFHTALADSQLLGLPELRRVEFDRLRYSNRLERTDAVALAAFYVAHFSDGTHQAVYCEFAADASQPALIAFANDVEAVLPATDRQAVQRVVDACLSTQPQQVQALLDAQGQARFQQDVARLFMDRLADVLGTRQPQVDQLRVLHVYQQAERTDQASATLIGPRRTLTVQTTWQADRLQAFHFAAPELETFAHDLQDFAALEEFGREFLRQWMRPDLTTQALQKMAPTAEPQQLLAQLAAQRDHLANQHGHYLWSDLLNWQVLPGENAIAAVYEMEFADQTLDMQLTFQLDAIGAYISTAQLLGAGTEAP